MTQVVPDKLLKAVHELEQEACIELWEIDLRKVGGELLRFCNYTNSQGENVVWKGETYQAYPVEGSGFAYSVSGESKRPTIKVANLSGLVTAIVEKHDSLLGIPVVRRQTLTQFLDAVNFSDGNPTADPEQELVQKFVVERLVQLDREVGAFELAVPSEAEGATIPCRLMLADVCCWEYRDENCGYTGRPVADEFDNPTDDPQRDRCSKKLRGCRARFGLTAVLPIGCHPSSDKIG